MFLFKRNSAKCLEKLNQLELIHTEALRKSERNKDKVSEAIFHEEKLREIRTRKICLKV